MKVTELMVGDWVYVSGKPVKITKDDLATMLIFLDDDSKISPILIIEEILVKNGFVVESCGCVWYQEHGIQEQNYLIVGFRKNGEPRRVEVFFVNKIKAEIRGIYYVHQLQHLLWLCGIEKVIEL